jgi:hypothetical protein
LKRGARTRTIEFKKVTAIAVPYPNVSHIICPRSWLDKKVFCLTQEKYNDIRAGGRMKDEIIIEIAKPHGNACHVLTAKAWLRNRVWAMVESEYNELRGKRIAEKRKEGEET